MVDDNGLIFLQNLLAYNNLAMHRAPSREEDLADRLRLRRLEDQSRKNKSLQVDGMDHALVVQNKNRDKESAHHSKSGAGQSSEKSKGDSDKSKKKGKCHYCKKPGHYISEYKKRIAKEKKKESSLVVSASGDSSTAKEESANFVQDSYAFVVCSDFSAYSVDKTQMIWYAGKWTICARSL
ncbi:hypothetical protein GOP47_0014765 [Adiantum capillus-veneris]|uniref:Uncharacterized protein n=1 Tax=Adiantum capillus-veneris TaxID=13818 RepID=A0A9D4UMY9_ADICA|nr:hypothetical protein GOP47_0014765 [Adiantum capillus-veneris]